MTDPIFQSDQTYEVARKLMDAAAIRQSAIASNIANAETPGYRRLDVATDFVTQLKAAVATGAPTADLDSIRPALSVDPTARTVRPDGNSVDLERELIAMNRNSVEFSYLTEVVSGSIKQLKTAITGNVTA
jgi:flagellar basal-body rod protein FlgB